MAILIKRYANRKLYNTQASRYITLKGIAELIDQGEEIRVIDNETGEDITQVALSQILVDSERSNNEPSHSLLSQIVGRGGDALYGALRRGIDDASESIEDIQNRVRRIVQPPGAGESERSEDDEAGSSRRRREVRSISEWIAYASPDLEHMVEEAVERVFKLLDLPRRSDVEALNENLERVAEAVQALEKAYAQDVSESPGEPSD